ncbi:NAD(P)H-dependent oxidoreductase [Mesorhizobium sp. B3-1-3]|uniref:NADPH-dependent FMN reductase n=1 Tax=unclassified Mesorhizobium TaxID=325217 RepID=UPI00112E5DF1|nr:MULTISPECIES: NAD(P)H-dependent oxidoreductase [unclassified Mesorhizobium]TPI57359.1 NAD(P)H-dependent oxidoreductase [Mesorhizobium sp. B3-1-8]TPI63512.1 NAD(P)H-dependent oxidoreductase [Mesorhizobium sp. B3-1-3]
MLKVSVVVGNPKPRSRTAKIAESFARQLVGPSDDLLRIIDLADHVDEIFLWPAERMQELNQHVAESQLVIFCSPTYKASYTGLLKAFLDRYPANGLRGVTALALMTGADMGHSMAPTVNLVPLLLELGATVPVRGIYFNTSQMDQVDDMIRGNVELVRESLNLVGRLVDGLGPPTTTSTGARAK